MTTKTKPNLPPIAPLGELRKGETIPLDEDEQADWLHGKKKKPDQEDEPPPAKKP
jgi:hypothetical protein